MTNPWLGIPADDYVGHMSHPTVNQRPVLNRLMREALEVVRPRSLLVLGCSTGNGLEYVDPAVTRRVTVVDINAVYLQQLADRFPSPDFDLQIQCSDLNETVLETNAFDLMHAALVFEYVEWRQLVPRLAAALTKRGVLSVVLQLQSATNPAVTPTKFTSLLSLEPLFRFVNADDLASTARAVGLTLDLRCTVPLAGGKSFEWLRFARRSGD
jgi:ubiquinone/menaquinone biosynthesis C-methylase UbiE